MHTFANRYKNSLSIDCISGQTKVCSAGGSYRCARPWHLCRHLRAGFRRPRAPRVVPHIVLPRGARQWHPRGTSYIPPENSYLSPFPGGQEHLNIYFLHKHVGGSACLQQSRIPWGSISNIIKRDKQIMKNQYNYERVWRQSF